MSGRVTSKLIGAVVALAMASCAPADESRLGFRSMPMTSVVLLQVRLVWKRVSGLLLRQRTYQLALYGLFRLMMTDSMCFRIYRGDVPGVRARLWTCRF
ncbi:MAG: hypothetical protein CM1200mP25_0190 [Acidobacteriota bacterium]|nr:MAG: hypothetical protein CM1200mP25_0190 [Acidobacteriota bacterium]